MQKPPWFAAQKWRLPPDVRSWRATALVVLLVVAPPLVTSWLAPNATSLAHQADIVGLFVYPVVLTAALHVYFHWRLTENAAAGWLSIWLFAFAMQGLSRVALRIEYADALRAHAVQLFLVDVLFATVVLVGLTLLTRRELRVDPGALGVAIGLGFGALRLAAVTDPRTVDLGGAGIVALQLFLLMLHLTIAAFLLRLRPLPSWVRVRLAGALVLLSVNHAIYHPLMDETWYAAAAIATDLAGATILASTSMALLRGSTRRRRMEIVALNERIDETENDHRGDRERLHEIGATVAGIACASRLIHEPVPIPDHRREQLQQMVGSEIARLERLIQQRPTGTNDVDLDETIRPLVVAHHARGHVAQWSPTRLSARGREDDIAEVIHILLDNAARHAAGAPVSITGREIDDSIEIRVQDSGPGIPPELGDRVFLHGERGHLSQGQGIGLNVAARLMEGMDGSVQLASTTQGTAFVLRMPKARGQHVAPSSSSQ